MYEKVRTSTLPTRKGRLKAQAVLTLVAPTQDPPKFFRAISGSYSASKSRDLEGVEEKAGVE